jgi:hypothetical protein
VVLKRETMRILHRSRTSTWVVLAVGLVLAVLRPSESWAQEKHRISLKGAPANTKYTQQYVIDVGDMPGHQVRVAENHVTYPDSPPMIEGIKVVEAWNRYSTDYTDLNGQLLGYGIFVLENGDKVFTRAAGTSQSVVKADGSRRTTFSGTSTITGGTGKFRNIRGTLRTSAVFDPKAGYIDSDTDGDYWLE